MSRDEVIAAIYEAIRCANELRAPGQHLECAEGTALFGPGALDSLGLVSLILDVEQAVADQEGVRVVLADEHALSQRRSPFRDVAALADHVVGRLAGARP